jgi:hypothetical protein
MRVSISVGSLALLASRSKQDLVHINFPRLTDGEGDCSRERFGWDRVFLIELVDVACDTGLRDAAREVTPT